MQKNEWEHLIPEGTASSFEKFEELGPVLQEYAHLKKESGSMFRIPEQATPEELAKARARLGAGASADDYSVPEGLSEEAVSMVSRIRDLAHQGGMAKDAFPKVAGAIDESFRALQEARTKAHDEAMEKWIKESRGAANFEEDRAYAQEFINNNLTEEERSFLRDSGANNMPSILKLFARIGRQNGGQVTPPDSPDPVDSEMGKLGKARKIVGRLKEIDDIATQKQNETSGFWESHEGKRLTAEIKYRNQELRDLGFPDGRRDKQLAEEHHSFESMT